MKKTKIILILASIFMMQINIQAKDQLRWIPIILDGDVQSLVPTSDEIERLKENAKFIGRIVDTVTGRPVRYAEVFLKLRGKVYRDLTDHNGYYAFYVPEKQLKGIDTVFLLQIYSYQYKSKVIRYKTIKAGTVYNLGTNGKIEKHPRNVLRFPHMKEAGALHHLGDDNYEGSENSQFQLRTEGTTFGKNILRFTLDAERVSRYSKIEVTFLAKGVQKSNKVKIIKESTKRTVLRKYMSDSATNGSYTPYKMTFDISDLETGTYYFEIEADTTFMIWDGYYDYDDFEFVNFYAILK